MTEQKTGFKTVIFLVLIIIIGALLRIWHLDKPEGLWFDEMNTYIEAKMPLNELIQLFFKKHIHTPLFYILLHFWMNMFGEADLILRVLPVIFGTLTIPVIYLCAKELNCKKTALWAAFFIAINSLLIYYSQEVRIYSLTALFSSLITLFLLRMNNNPSKTNILCLALANAGLLYTHSISFVFVFFEFLIFGAYFFLKRKNSFKPLLLSGFFAFLLYTPLLYKIFNMVSDGVKYSGIVAQWWSKFTFSSVVFAFGDNFSPYLTGNWNPPDNYLLFISKNPLFCIIMIITIVIPALIGLYGLLRTIFQKQILQILLLLICLGFMSVFALSAMKGKVVYLSRYIIEVTPIFILVFTYGIVNKPVKVLSKTLLAVFLIINLFFLVFTPLSTSKASRQNGFKPGADILKKYKLSDNDYYILEGSKKNLFHKYFPPGKSDTFYEIHNWNARYFSQFLTKNISLKEITDISYYRGKPGSLPAGLQEKIKLVNEKIADTDHYKKYLKHNNYKNFSYEYYGDIIGSKNNIFDDTKIHEEIFSKITGQNHLVLIINRGMAVYPRITEIKALARHTDDTFYKNQILMYMLHSRIAYDLIEISQKELALKAHERAGNWDIYIFKKGEE